ncbi:hypothetical protein F5X68DRAFT_192001 [Plectosphaerella plurivora]|uniref:Uncharacterized protein n=1 Tax=Plectosphaerella plurivora TaxID=936078 RepID=A0A9P8V8M9_9PEZI|nr:hypothetical protein F5X68DRAFT_192001 [Plectosphaerella plurivora]
MRTAKTAFGTLLLARTFEFAAANNDTLKAPWTSGFRDYDVAENFTQPPNATGQLSIPGVDLTKPWAGNDSFGDDWNIYAAAFAGLPGLDNTVAFPTNQWLRIPEDSFEGDEIDNGWSICSYPFYNFKWFRGSLEEAQDDPDNDCAGAIPQQCIDELLARTNSLGGCDDDWDRASTSIDSCDDVTAWGLSDFSVFPFNDQRDIADVLGQRMSSDNGTAISLYGRLHPYAHTDNQTMRDEVYDTAISDVIPYIISYKYQTREKNESHSVFKCVRANNLADGSRVPEGVGRVADGGNAVGVPIMLIGIAAIFALCI